MADWTPQEVKLIVADYLAMLADELAGKPYNKSEHRRMLMPLLPSRTDKAIEYKYQNISAALIDLGAVFIRGYKPMFNYQALLKNECITQLELRKSIWENEFTQFADSAPMPRDYSNNILIFVTPPESGKERKEKKDSFIRKPFKVNYLQREQQNTKSGQLGEQLVISFEKNRLIQDGKESLADKIEWVSKYHDGAGFDILSKNDNGSDRYIEVKSTKLSKQTPIFFSNNEFEFANKNGTNYYLYRVFNLIDNPRFFTINGDFDSFCQKEPIQFKGYF
jgi:hypothetical protein